MPPSKHYTDIIVFQLLEVTSLGLPTNERAHEQSGRAGGGTQRAPASLQTMDRFRERAAIAFICELTGNGSPTSLQWIALS